MDAFRGKSVGVVMEIQEATEEEKEMFYDRMKSATTVYSGGLEGFLIFVGRMDQKFSLLPTNAECSNSPENG